MIFPRRNEVSREKLLELQAIKPTLLLQLFRLKLHNITSRQGERNAVVTWAIQVELYANIEAREVQQRRLSDPCAVFSHKAMAQEGEPDGVGHEPIYESTYSGPLLSSKVCL